MTFNLYDLKFNTRMNSTYKSTLKALKRLNFGLKAGLLSTAKSAIQRARRRRRGGIARRRNLHCFKPKQTTALPTYDTAKHDYVPKWNAL